MLQRITHLTAGIDWAFLPKSARFLGAYRGPIKLMNARRTLDEHERITRCAPIRHDSYRRWAGGPCRRVLPCLATAFVRHPGRKRPYWGFLAAPLGFAAPVYAGAIRWTSRYAVSRPATYSPVKGRVRGLPGSVHTALSAAGQHGVRVKRLSKIDDEFVVETAHGIWNAASIVVATGGYQLPVIPAYADSLDPRIVQLHSGDYRNPSQLRSGDVLLVGAGNSGADICMEVGRFHRTYLSGNGTGHVPFRIEGRPGRYLVPLVRFLGHHVLNYGTPIGRRAIPGMIGKGGPLIRVKPHEITAAGVERLPCVTGVHEGKPLLEDGRVVDVTNVIWCTGFRRDFSWIDLPTFGPEGEPEHLRGVAIGKPNVAFVGLPFQYAATSDVITGVARDAAYVVKRIGKHRRLNAPEREPSIAGESPYKEPARRAR